jgi:uncharacterized protein (DUF362 family)
VGGNGLRPRDMTHTAIPQPISAKPYRKFPSCCYPPLASNLFAMKTQLTESPFKASAQSVFVTSGPDPYENTLTALSNIDLTPAKGKNVLLKPNAGRLAAPGKGITTDPRVVAAAIEAFTAAGANVSVGDSPITGIKSLDAIESTGIAAVARDRGCKVVDLDEKPALEVAIPNGTAIQSIKICPEVFDHDIVISIPVMKTHMHTGVSLSIKNMKGCLWKRSKVDLHMLPVQEGSDDKPLNIAIADMATALTPHMAIIDGTVGMEGLGPSAGKPKTLNAIVVGADPFAADAVACALMGLNAHSIPHLRISAEQGLGIIDLDKINISPDNWEDFGSDFETSPDNLSIEFPNVNIMDNQSCSACQSTLLLFLQHHGEELSEYIPKGEVLNMAIGKGHETVPEGTICIGNCTEKHREKGTFVSGCPPVSSEIQKALRNNRKPQE